MAADAVDPWSFRSVSEASAERSSDAPAWIQPDVATLLELDTGALDAFLAGAPREENGRLEESPAVLVLPRPDGSPERFAVALSPVMASELEAWMDAQGHPFRSYVGTSLDRPATSVRLDWGGPFGFHASVLGPDGSYSIDPWRLGDVRFYSSYARGDLTRDTDGFRCALESSAAPALRVGDAPAGTGGVLRTYRLANAATGEYSAVFGGTVANAQAAIATTINRVNQVYERDLAVRLTLVGNNQNIVYTNGATDPYSNDDGGAMLSQNQANVDAVIGTANYDIGHVFSTGGGGIASLGVVCNASFKARGVTGLSNPQGDPFDIDFVSHEIGHQFGGNHPFNSETGSCGGGNRNGSTAYEPGSGSTIQAYAGICGADNLQSNSDPYFHTISLDEMLAYVSSGGTCFASTPGVNPNSPTVDAGPNFTIPIGTPFELTPSAFGDLDGHALTFTWEEFDLGPAKTLASGDNGQSPIIRSVMPTANPTRTVPALTKILNGTVDETETLPTTNRTMTFRAVVRDNVANGGRTFRDAMSLTSTTSSGPFTVTSPNGGETVSGNFSVTWNPANTTTAPVSTGAVDVLLSADGGMTYPITLASGTPNDGQATLSFGAARSAAARVKIRGTGNVFFDLSNGGFTVNPVPGTSTAGLFDPGVAAFFLRNVHANGPANETYFFGAAGAGWTPFAGDWNGDGLETVALHDGAAGTFFLRNVHGPGPADVQFAFGPGGAGWIPIGGDWDGDGTGTIGLYDPATGAFFLRNSNGGGNADLTFFFGPGGQGWIPIAGDWDGDGDDTVGVYDPANGAFFLRNAHVNGPADETFFFGPGGAGWKPIAGDWNASGTDNVGVYDPANGPFFLRNTHANGPADETFFFGPGGAGWIAIAGNWDAL